MELDTNQAPWKTIYKLMTGAVVPRPIGWISSISPDGRPNLAPFSFFNIASANPPHVLFCPMVRGSDGQMKDTLRNVRQGREKSEPGEFVVNIVTEALAEQMNLTAGEYPGEVNEFEMAALTPIASVVVRPPRVAESPIHFECVTAHILKLGEGPGAASIVVGRVVHLHVDEQVLLGEDKINLQALRPIGRLAGSAYTRVTDTFEIIRPR